MAATLSLWRLTTEQRIRGRDCLSLSKGSVAAFWHMHFLGDGDESRRAEKTRPPTPARPAPSEIGTFTGQWKRHLRPAGGQIKVGSQDGRVSRMASFL